MNLPPSSETGNSQATYLRELISRLGLSQRAAAQVLGVDERLFRHWCADSADRPCPPEIFSKLRCLDNPARFTE